MRIRIAALLVGVPVLVALLLLRRHEASRRIHAEEKLAASELGLPAADAKSARWPQPAAAVESQYSPRPRTDGGVTRKSVATMFEISEALYRNADEAAASVERFCAEAAKLPKHLFATPPTIDPEDPSSQLRDAAYVLTPLIDWFGQPGKPGTPGQLHLPPGLHDRIAAAGTEWLTALSIGDTSGLDFDWITGLSAFDHWSLATTGPTALSAATVDPPNLPIPDYRMLIDYAKLHLVRALASGDGKSALADVQHLADLIHSNGIAIGDGAAIRILEAESRFAARTAGSSGTPGVAPVDAAVGDSFRQIELASMAFTFPEVDAAVSRRALSCMPTPCVALGEGISLRRTLDAFTDSAEAGASFAQANGSACDRTLFALFETAPVPAAGDAPGGEEPLPLERLFPDLKARK